MRQVAGHSACVCFFLSTMHAYACGQLRGRRLFFTQALGKPCASSTCMERASGAADMPSLRQMLARGVAFSQSCPSFGIVWENLSSPI